MEKNMNWNSNALLVRMLSSTINFQNGQLLKMFTKYLFDDPAIILHDLSKRNKNICQYKTCTHIFIGSFLQ